MEVYICSNKSCNGAYSIDPRGHCPKCRKPDGGGWSCRTYAIQDDLLFQDSVENYREKRGVGIDEDGGRIEHQGRP